LQWSAKKQPEEQNGTYDQYCWTAPRFSRTGGIAAKA
jgi:hypothetical protein